MDTGQSGAAGSGYRVLARKYRPSSFADLVGHDAMVRTLRNAFSSGRIAQAWMLTGVRGIGKTTTARILARALNYELPGRVERPSVDLAEEGTHCRAILEGRHVDVIEMDAASHTGVGDVREIIEASRYKPASARYKVYVIDEVHMLSTSAFNALLKTLEEPPPHVKFIMATTEIRKVPVTVLSRCQRFDLRRLEPALLIGHLGRIAGLEGVAVEEDAVALIARAADGSVRDGLTLLDQAIAHGDGTVTADAVRSMLGLADRTRVVALFDALMRGDVAAALTDFADQYAAGADPVAVLSDLAAFIHVVTRVAFLPAAADDPTLSPAERDRAPDYAARLSVKVLSRAWQMLLKGIAEVQAAPRPLPAAEMVLVRIAHAADLPTPDEALRMLRDGGAPVARPAPSSTPGGGGPGPRAVIEGGAAAIGRPAPVARHDGPVLASLEDVVRLAGQRRDVGLQFALERHVRLVGFSDGHIEFEPVPGASPALAGDIGRKLTQWTGRRWIVSLARDGAPTLHEVKTAARARLVDDARADPVVAAILARFPGAEIVDVRQPAEVRTEGEAGALADFAPPEVWESGLDADGYDPLGDDD